MTSISVPQSVKNEFTALQPEHCDSQGDFVDELLSVYRAAQTSTVDVDKLTNSLQEVVANQAEVGAYRGTAEVLELEDVRP